MTLVDVPTNDLPAADTTVPVMDYAPPLAKPPVSLRDTVLRGSAWTIFGFAAAQVLRLASNVVLTHYLEPGVFGIMALILTFISGVSLFTDFGLAPAIIQSRRGDDERFLNTAFTIQLGRGLLIWLALCALATPAARYFQHFELRLYLPVCGIVAMIGGFNSTSLYSLNRHMGARTLTTINLITQVIAMAVTVGWAIIHPSIWALIGGQVIGPLVYMVISHTLDTGEVPHRRVRNRIAWDRDAAQELFHFGKWIFICTILFYLQSQVDRLVFDKRFHDIWLLGLYALALQLVQLPGQVISNLVGAMLLPALAKNAERMGSWKLEDSRDRIMEARRLILPAGVAAMLAVSLGAPLFFQMLYKPIYRGAGVLTQFMVPGAWFAVLQLSVDRALQMSNQLSKLALSNAVNLIFTIIGAIVGAKFWGVNGFILGLGVGNLAGHVVVQIAFLRAGILLLGQDLRYTAMVAILTAAGLFLPRILTHTPASHLAVKIVLAVGIIGATGAWSAKRVMLLRPRNRAA